jgi:nucleotide-binding universal stress UspA family protein
MVSLGRREARREEAVMETIVVGVDGSECANAALAFAAAEAALREGRLVVVSAWEVPSAIYGGGFAPALDAETLQGFGERARAIAEAAVVAVKKVQPSVVCEAKAVEGQAAAVLLQEAADATLIVVGNRGLGGFARLLLGSVSQQVVHHAACPVVVVHSQTASSPQ